MKINKKNPKHWLILLVFTLNVTIILLLRLIFRNRKNHVIIYGHKLNGNIKAIYYGGLDHHEKLKFYFLTIDPNYYKDLTQIGVQVINGLNLKDMLKLLDTRIIISDHGLHSLELFIDKTDIKFIDVWHGLPFKGFDQQDFKLQRKYDETWVTSSYMMNMYINQYKFEKKNVIKIGYARTDILVKKETNLLSIKENIGIPKEFSNRKVILFAPTWIQDDRQRNIYPFVQEELKFLEILTQVCQETNSLCLLRKHLNSPIQNMHYPDYIFDCSYAKFPDAESVLLITDLLICDWSSIVFDYLLLERPTIFLDVPPPFKKGFSLDDNFRFGHIVNNVDDLIKSMDKYLVHPHQYHQEYSSKYNSIKSVLYDDLADGNVVNRCIERITTLINS